MNFNFDNDRPIYVQLVEQLKLKIISGKFQCEDRLPSVRELALQMKVNPNTMQKALAELETDKLIYTERTNGKFVTKDKSLIENTKKQLANDKIKKFLFDMNQMGIPKEELTKYLQEWEEK